MIKMRKAKLTNVKEETSEDLSKYKTKMSSKSSSDGSKVVAAIKKQSDTLVFEESNRPTLNLDSVKTLQKKSLEKGSKESRSKNESESAADQSLEASSIVPAVRRQSEVLSLKVASKKGPEKNLRGSVDLQSLQNSGLVHAVMQQSAALNTELPVQQSRGNSGLVHAVMQQSAALNTELPVQQSLGNSGLVRAVMQQSAALNTELPVQQSLPPPPPPPAPDLQGYLAHPPLNQPQRIKLNPKDLLMERKKLKKPYEIVKQVDIERDDFFDVHKNYKYMPMVDARESLRLSTLRTEVVSISFDGIEQLTDAFLFSLHHCKLSLNTVKWISLTGCYNVTDEGVYWISLAFPNIKSIQLSGCSKVTEKSLYYLSKLNMQKIIMDGTSCGVLPVFVNIGPSDEQKPGSPNVSTDGCPLISPLSSEVQKKSSIKSWSPGNFTVPYRKLVILSPEDLPWNPLAVLSRDKDLTPKLGLTYKQGWTPFKDHKIKSEKSSAETFNVFQITRNKGLNEMVLSPGSIVILPYHLQQDMPASPAAEIANTIVAVTSKYDDCSFVVLAMSDSKDSSNYEPTVDKMYENVKKYLAKWNDRLQAAVRTSIHTNWRMAAFNYQDQESLSAGEKNMRQMKTLLGEDLSTLTSSHIKVGENMKLSSSDLKFLLTAVEADEYHFRWNRQPLMSSKVLDYSSTLKKLCLSFTELADVQKLCKFQGLPERTYTSNMAKLITYSALWGHCLYYPQPEIGPVVTDFQFLADIVQKLMFTSAPRSCDLRCLGDNIPCWTHQDLLKVWQGASEQQITLLIHLLEKLGCLMTFAIDEWSNIQDVSFVYVFYKDFPEKPSPMLEQYWPLKRAVNVVERNKFYFCSPGLPDSFFPNLLRHIFKLGGPLLTWKDGAVIEKGHLSILVEKIHEFQGLPVIVIQVRGPAVQEMMHLEDWTTLKLYTTVMDQLALEYKLSYAKTVPCLNCPSADVQDRYEILGSKKPGRYFHEHLIRAGENRDVKCKHCSEPSNTARQIGPAISLTDMVPHHDRTGCASPTTNLFSRCLMCANCAADGIYCPINLKQGIRNWSCGCDQEGMLCNYCGMCQRCFLCIKTAVSTVDPVFLPPKSGRYSQDQLVALDEVKVTEKGSILGLLTAAAEISLKNHILKPNYSPVLSLTVVKHGHFWLSLLTSKKTFKYGSETGQVYEVEGKGSEKELLGRDVFRTCQNGDTIEISLQYLKGTFTMMRLCLFLNATEIFSTETKAADVTVSIYNGSTEGVFMQIVTPNKFLRSQQSEKGEKKSEKNCGQAVMNLPCALEMKMYGMLDAMEQVCFGGRGISLTGSACVSLPSEITLDCLKYPRLSLLNDVNYHHLCLTWNPVGGKASLGKKSKGDSSMADRMSYSSWMLKRLVHLLDAPGIPQSKLESVGDLVPIFWMWHFIMSTYPEMILPGTTSKLLTGDFLTTRNQLQVKEGLRSLVRLGMWKHFSQFDIDSLEKTFKANSQGKLILTANNDIIQGSLVLQELLQNNIEMSGLKQIYSRFNKNLALYLCLGHADCMRMKESLPDVLPELMGTYSEFVTFIDISYNDISVIPDKFFSNLPNLLDLKIAHNFIDTIPDSIKECKKLMSLVAMENNLSDLPEEITQLKHIQTLEIGNNCFSRVPDVVMKLTGLTKLAFPYMMLTEMPEDIGNLEHLRFLHAQGNCFTRLPKSFEKLTNLEEVLLTGVQWAKLSSSQENLTYQEFQNFLLKKIDRWLRANGESKKSLFQFFDENSNGVLDIKEIGKLNATVFNKFPRFGYKGKEQPDETTPHGFPVEILKCKKLKVLLLQNQGFTKIPPEICQLENLYELNISHNPNLLAIPAEVSQIKTLKKLDLDDCPLLKTPPREIREKGFHSTFAYLQRLMSGAVLSKRTKLMLVGLGGAGKTSLVKALLSSDGKAELKQGEEITDGIDIQTWQVSQKEEKITYNIWDFAGQTVYYNTHQFFLSANRAIYLLLWNVRLGHEHAGLDFWLSSISVQAPNAPVFVIGTHVDQVSKSELPIEEMQQRYPQIVGFHFISSYTGQGVDELKTDLIEVTLQQQYMGEYIPGVWLTFEKNIDQIKSKNDIVKYSDIEMLANKSGIFEPSEIYQAVQFLHDLGSVQHFSNEYLKSQVVINPQWIVDVMACVVSVKIDVIKNGRLLHDDIDKVWSAYPKNLRSWLLRLTEEFDLTFQLKDQPVNIVPCLLPEKKSKFVWPEIERGSDIRENKMVYTFDYLPAGLFNRAQVRLHSLSDSALIWKKGSYLVKNVHVALLQHVKDSEMIVTAQGPRPENILFLVHEVFEGLIAESFHGVTYDFTMPCPECLSMGVKDPHMFCASTIRRALDMKAPFLQCIKYFHTISCAALQMLLPPDSHSDFDVHLVNCVQGLKHLQKDLAADIFISYCDKDDLVDKSSYIYPGRVHSDLVNKGYKCWCKGKGESESTDEMAKALIDSSVFLAFVSLNYANDVDCVNIFKYARLTLKKTIIVVAIGDGFEWKQSKLGILLADEVFVNMTKPKLQYYDSKFEELLKTLKDKTRTGISAEVSLKPDVFFSYSWTNSEQAVKLGTREVAGAIGYGDPRELKSYLEEQGIRCWIDVERLGMNGLFDDIAEGLLNAKVVIVCVSDEYASSPACLIEFRYAASTLKLPIIMAVVGTGDSWRATEIGLMSVNYPIVNFQEKTKNARKKLLKLVQERLDSGDDGENTKAQKNKSNEDHKTLSYQELFELGQRRLLRQLTIYAENQDLDIYPRVFVVDFVRESEEEYKQTTDEDDKDLGQEKLDVGREKSFLSRENTSAKKFLSKKSSVMLPAYRLQKYCVYTLCEHDEGWHSVAEPIELSGDFGVTDLDTYSPYLSRMTTVMKFNKKLVLNCLTDDIGEAYIDWLEKSPEATMSDYQNVYHSFREMVLGLDVELKMGHLSRCHLPNGKTIWLCNKHRDSMRVTCLSNDDKSVNMTKDAEDKVTNWMLTGLRSMDLDLFDFKSIGNAPRSEDEMNKYGLARKEKEAKKGKREKGKCQNAQNRKSKKVEETNDKTDNVDGSEKRTKKIVEEPSEEREAEAVVKEKKGNASSVQETISSTVMQASSKTDIGNQATERQQSEETASVTSSTSAPSSAADKRKQRRPLPGQSQYKVPTYSQKSRACVIS